MSVIFVSENKMLQNMLQKACEDRKCEDFTSYETIEDIPALLADCIVLLHVTASPEQAAQQIEALQARKDDVRIILLAREKLTDKLRANLAAQTHAIIPENNSIETLIGAIIVVQHGYRISRDDCSAKPVARKQADGTTFTLNDIKGLGLVQSSEEALLSNRERCILARLSKGGSNKDIANDLGIQEATVKVHLRACYRKIGARNRTQAAVWAVERLQV
ncbi:response regulator transcription factor [Roseovarius sp. S4756]|uniref:helix-turn-helix transcriptional regulator n=1 Tax=Roseovarius maritimus TaxID=3342637 RepID=UPI00372B8B96